MSNVRQHQVQELLRQIREAIAAHSYFLALYVSLTIPDICGALEADDGQVSRARYIAWFDRYIAPNYTIRGHATLTGEVCYYYRCAVLHQGRARYPKLGYSRILFAEPGANTTVFHNKVLNDALNIDVSVFCGELLAGAEAWLVDNQASPNVLRNIASLMQRHPNGLAPYLVGVPVIA